MKMRVIFHVDMNAFFASVEQVFNPALRGKPVAVCGNAKKRSVVAACSYEAKAFGIQNGMSVHEARALCPKLLLVGGDPEKYIAISQRIFAMLEGFSPQMEIFSIDEAFLEMTDTYRFFGAQPEEAAQRIKRRIAQGWGLTCSVGIGPNKLIAKLASDLKKPDGLVRIRAEELPLWMERLPVEALCGVGPHLKQYLHELGIVTCADLGRAPEGVLVERFGVIGRALKRMGQGKDEAPVALAGEAEPVTPPPDVAGEAGSAFGGRPFGPTSGGGVKSMGHSYTLPRDTADGGEIRGTLLRLCEQVARRLRLDGYQGRTVWLTIRYADFSTFSHQKAVPESTDAGLAIYRIACHLLRRHHHPLPKRVRLIGVGVSGLVRSQRQVPLFPQELQRERVDRCMDRVSDRFGEWTVVRAAALAPFVPKSHGFLVKRYRRNLLLR